MVVSIVWIPVIQASQGSELFVYIQQVSSFMQPPICCIFILGLFWERLNEAVSLFQMLNASTVVNTRFEWISFQIPCVFSWQHYMQNNNSGSNTANKMPIILTMFREPSLDLWLACWLGWFVSLWSIPTPCLTVWRTCQTPDPPLWRTSTTCTSPHSCLWPQDWWPLESALWQNP